MAKILIDERIAADLRRTARKIKRRLDAISVSGTGATEATTVVAHADSHKSGGSDPIKLDELSAPTDITTLNASVSAHGLLPKLGGGTTNYLRADGTWAAPGGASSHNLLSATHSDTTTGTVVLGDIIVGDATPKWIRKAGNTIAVKKFLTQTGTGTASAEPEWATILAADLPSVKLDDWSTPDDNTDLNVSTSYHGLCPKLPGTTTVFLRGDGSWQIPAAGDHVLLGTSHTDTLATTVETGAIIVGNSTPKWAKLAGNTLTTTKFLTSTGTGSAANPPAWSAINAIDLPNHAINHKSGGGDPIKLDELAAPTDITTLNASVSAHGLCPKLGGGTTNYLRADGSWATPAGSTHNVLDGSVHPDTLAGTVVLGDLIHGNATPKWARLAGNTTATKKFLTQTGTGSASAVPVWDTIIATDLPNHATRHQSGGADPIKLDDLATPDDNNDLNASTSYHGLLRKLTGSTADFLRADGTWQTPPGTTTHNLLDGSTHPDTTAGTVTTGDIVIGNVTPKWARLPGNTSTTRKFLVSQGAGASANPPSWDTLASGDVPTHATSHKSGGGDSIKIDEFAAPTDITSLNVSTSAHGLCPKAPNDTAKFLRGDASWAAPPTSTDGDLFGDGNDGDVTITGSTTLTREMRYTNLTISTNVVVNSGGYTIRVNGTLTLNSGAVIHADGVDGTAGQDGTIGGAGGAASSSGVQQVWTARGTDGSTCPDITGDGNTNYNGGTAPDSTIASTLYVPLALLPGGGGGAGGSHGTGASNSPAPTAATFGHKGGNGGNGTGTGQEGITGGGGGGGGGVLIIYAKTINNGGTIRANGGAGGNGVTVGSIKSGNGGGGGGGSVVIFYRSTSGSGLGTYQANGGSAGTGGNGGTSGTTGKTATRQL